MLVRFDPFHDFDRLFGQLRDGARGATIPFDAYRRGDVFHVDFDLPGVRPESIDVTVEKNVLTISAERHQTCEDAETVVCERPQGSFSRQLLLGDTLDTDKVEASYVDGVLALRIPVAEEAKPKRIEVGSVSEANVITTAHAA